MKITLSGENKVNEVPVLGAWMHPAGFVLVCLLEDCVCHNQPICSAHIFSNKEPLAFMLPIPVRSDHSAPDLMISSNPGIEVAQYV